MSWLTRDQVKTVIVEALREVADTGGDIEGYEIAELTDRHQVVFMEKIAEKLGGRSFRVTMTLARLQGCSTMAGLIDYIEENQESKA